MATPSPVFATAKSNILAAMRAKGCIDVAYVDQNLNSFGDVPELLREYASTFDCDPAYLEALAGCVDDATLLSLGIYLNKTLASADNPIWIIHSTIAQVNIFPVSDIAFRKQLHVVDSSPVANISITGAIQLDVLSIGSGAVVGELYVEDGSCINYLLLKGCETDATSFGTLEKLDRGSCYKNFGQDDTAVFGALACPAPI